jgi:SAM-dependent methyltransferase
MSDNPFAVNTAPATAECKCCSALARITGVVDFSRSCQDSQLGRKVEPYAGRAIYYYACQACGFVFTKAFDTWSIEDFARYIYNDKYIIHDPEYADIRPEYLAAWLDELFASSDRRIRILDYGSGAGQLARHLTGRGFGPVESYDPFSSPRKPSGVFKLVTCFEVFEHAVDPRALIADILACLDDDGAVIFSTLLCSEETLASGIANWWYCAPRNGHISFYSRETLNHFAREHGLNHAWFDESRHVFYREKQPAYLQRLLAPPASA